MIMKKFSTYTAILITVAFAFISCRKETARQATPVIPVINNAPVADVGNDTAIFLPYDKVLLSRSNSHDPDPGDVLTYKWKKIRGSVKFTLQTENSAECWVTNLEKGEYEFELTVKDKYDYYSTDRITVSVIDPKELSNIIEYDGLTWQIDSVQRFVYIETPDLTADQINDILSVSYSTFDFDYLGYVWRKLSRDGIEIGRFYYSVINNRVRVYKYYYDDDSSASTVFIGNRIKIVFR